MAAAGRAGRAAAAAAAMNDEVINISDSDRRRLVLYPLYRVDIIKDSIDFGGITSPAARQKVRFIVNTLFKLQEMRYNLTHYRINNTILQRYAALLTENTRVGEWRKKQYDIVDEELQNFTQRPILYPTCHLGYFQDREPSAHIVVPALYNNKPLKGFPEYHVNFGIHDSGKPPNFFDSDIRQVQTPGSFIDPASRSTADHLHMIDLDTNDFRSMGLSHLLDELTVTESHGSDVKYVVTLSLSGSTKFTFEFTDNVNKPVAPRESNNNNLLAGNKVKNAYINSEGSTPETNMNYMLVKLLGDLLQVYYGRKLINNRTYNKNQICIFTSDKNVTRLAQIFQIPCLRQDLEHKLQGSERSYYTYYAYNDGRDPNGDPITSHMRINKLECKKIIKHNTGIIRTFTECLDASAIYVGVKSFSPIPPPVVAYMTTACTVIADVNRTIESIHRTSGTNVYGDTLSLQMNPLEFKEVIDRYRATDAVRFTDVGDGIRAYSALTTRLIFPLLGAGNIVNTSINALKGDPVSREFRQFVYGSPMRVRDMRPEEAGAGAVAAAAAPSPDLLTRAVEWLKNVTSIDGIIRGVRSAFVSVFRGGDGKKGAAAGAGAGANNSNPYINDMPTTEYSKILNRTQYNELNNKIHEVIDRVISGINPKPDIFIEDVLALIYPYFALRGQFTINPTFYEGFINYITLADFTGYIDTRVVDVAYERIHSPPGGAGAAGAAAAAGGAGAAAPVAPGPEYNINGKVFLQPSGKNGAMNIENGGNAGVAATAPPSAADADNLYNSIPSILEAWQGKDIVGQIRSNRPNRPEGYDMNDDIIKMKRIRTAKDEIRKSKRKQIAKKARIMAIVRMAGTNKKSKMGAKGVKHTSNPKKGKNPTKHSHASKKIRKSIRDSRVRPAGGSPTEGVPPRKDDGGGGGGGGSTQINLEHSGGAHPPRKTRKKRVNTLKRKLRKFRDTGRI
jgi:hypothetical protein